MHFKFNTPDDYFPTDGFKAPDGVSVTKGVVELLVTTVLFEIDASKNAFPEKIDKMNKIFKKYGLNKKINLKKLDLRDLNFKQTSKLSTKGSVVFAVINIPWSVYDFRNSDMSPGDLSNMFTDFGSVGLSFVYSPAGFGVGAANDLGLFNSYYIGLDNIYESSGLYVIPCVYPFPVAIPTKF